MTMFTVRAITSPTVINDIADYVIIVIIVVIVICGNTN